ncbi:protein SODIUM POTASSIUM ROOT DEFECTIVE 3-like [Chenopodium quinoa]|uniref:protein SODIUM POTASSIUM ROOT DEFECTIVE 3-like n=1 Tax=Chenopodium quinoa TaxID=63459 RepID=UPI000B778426|nr:protein SODIUM POTASSIUM ROOT DEFECTIVE 3-like [Chenopodium quinoa]
MKGLNINISSCTSQDSTAIISSNMEVILPSSSSSSSSSFTPGSRAIDRHNPIITDERRSGISSTNGSCASTPIGTPCTNHVLQRKPPTPISPKPHQTHTPQKKGSNKLPTLTKKKTSKKNVTNNATKPTITSNNIIIDNGDGVHNKSGRRSFSKPSDFIMKAAACANTKPGVDYISPPESSRYLLDDTSFLEVLSDFDPVLKLKPYDTNHHNDDVEVVKPEAGSKPPKPPSSTGSSDQVVVLRVSLHCRGCERKMKKHLSRMPGVTSFNIDFAAKKVTVVGDVTPLGVLTSISKVKNAKLWTPATTISSSSQLNSRNMQLYYIK